MMTEAAAFPAPFIGKIGSRLAMLCRVWYPAGHRLQLWPMGDAVVQFSILVPDPEHGWHDADLDGESQVMGGLLAEADFPEGQAILIWDIKLHNRLYAVLKQTRFPPAG